MMVIQGTLNSNQLDCSALDWVWKSTMSYHSIDTFLLNQTVDQKLWHLYLFITMLISNFHISPLSLQKSKDF